MVSNNFYVIPAYFVWLILLRPILWLHPKLYWHIEDRFFGWLLGMVACWNYTAGYQVVESGERLEDIKDQNFLFMPNHQSTADVPLCMTIFAARPNFADRVMWVMDRVFKYSNFGAVSWMHDDFFILAGRDNRGRSLLNLLSHLQKVFVQKSRKYLVLFPEGGFLRKRKPISHRFALKNNLPLLEYVTLPRTGALEAILNVLGPHAGSVDLSLVDDFAGQVTGNAMNNNSGNPNQGLFFKDYMGKVVDVTIAYPNGQPLDLWTIVSGSRPPCVTHVHYRVFDTKELPSNSDGIKQWMYQLYYEKEEMLKEFYQTGKFPYSKFSRNGEETVRPRPLVHDPMKFIMLHIFFLTSSFFMINTVMALVSPYLYT